MNRTPSAFLAFIAFFAQSGFAQSKIPEIPVTPRVTGYLEIEGLDPNNEEDLLSALRRDDLASTGACFVLASRPAKARMDDELLAYSRYTQSDLGVLHAAYALSRHEDFRWVDDVASRFGKIEQVQARIMLAGYLAAAGRYDQWEYIRSFLAQKQKYQMYLELAVQQIPFFAGMKDETGQVVSLPEVLGELFRSAPPENQPAIAAGLRRLAPRSRAGAER